MKEIGEYIRETRKTSGVSLNEASADLGIGLIELEAIENGNFKAFKDVFELKKYLREYTKYLGLDSDKLLDEFNDFLFEKTSKITKENLKDLKLNETKEEKVTSPYTKIKPTRYDFAPIVLVIVILLLLSLIVYLGLRLVKVDKNVERELLNVSNAEVLI